MKYLTVMCGLLMSALAVSAQSMPELGTELLQMRDLDQAARMKCTGTADEQMKCVVKISEEIDRPNTKRLNEIIAAHGFPTAALVGADGVKAFALIMQHSGDIELRKKSKVGMARAFEDKVLSVAEYTGFVDRLLVDEGKSQIYGSNFGSKDGKLVMSPVEDPKNLDKRRKAIGLPPIAEYAKMLREAYKLEVVIPQPN